jgi:[protein-PII] uridylyltransferase
LENLKEHLKESIARLGEEYGNGLYGRELVRRYSSIVDECLKKIFVADLSSKGNGNNKGYAIAALGGYGREELSPYSDIDLMFLIPQRFNSSIEDITGRILYPLWDAGITVGYCNRTLKDCLTMMKEDITVRTSLMEMRYLMGDRGLYSQFQRSILKNALSKGVNSFISEQLKDMESRRRYYGDSVYLLEPHLKEGEGGLRDIQSALWIARVRFQARGIDELEAKGVLSSREISLLEESLEFLWKVRNGLHFVSGRKNDHLAFEYQEKIANALGYDDPDSTFGVRRFMHDYYQCAENIKHLSSVLIERSGRNPGRIKKIRRKASSMRMDSGFEIKNNRISVVDPDLLRRSPLAMMKVFRYSQELNKEIGIDTQELIRENLDLVDEEFRNSMDVNSSFISILRGKGGAAKTLTTMHRLGFLAEFIPEFAGITRLPQPYYYHVYTADIHTLFAVEEFENLLLGYYKGSFSFLSNLVKEENNAELIFLALLFHDLGKAFKTDHVEKGVELVHIIADRMGLSKEDTELVAFLVENHIYMSSVAQTRDLSDEHLIIKFAQKMKDMDRLRMLYILTFADLKASRAEAFNSWKATLFQELYIRAFHIIEKGGFTMTDIESKLDKIRNEVISELRPRMPMDDIHYNLDLMPSRYLLNNSPEIISNHILLCNNLEEGTLAFDVREKPDKGYYDILIATPDFHGLFYKVCGVMVYHNMNILDAQIDTRSDGIAIQLLRVNYLYNDATVDREEWKAIEDNLENVIDGRIKAEDLVKKRESYLLSKEAGLKDIKATIRIDNDTSDFYTVIDVETNDRFGLLYSITKAISDIGISIYIAKIATSLMRVTDSFYVRDIFGQKIYDESKLKRIRYSLFKVLEKTGGYYEED